MTNYASIEMAKRFVRFISYKDLGLANDDEYTDHVEEMVRVASRRIDQYCKRPDNFFYTSGGATITEYHNGKPERPSRYYNLDEQYDQWENWRRTFWLEQTPIQSITSVHENEASIGETDSYTTLTKYRVDNDTGELRFSSGETPGEGTKNVRFIYKAGYSSTPETIELACTMLVANYLQSAVQHDVTQRMNWAKPTPPDFQRPDVFTEDIKAMLQPYTKRRGHIA